MNQDRVEGIWKQVAGHVTEKWGRLTHDPRREVAGTNTRRVGALQEQYGISKEAAARQLKEFRDRNHNWHISN